MLRREPLITSALLSEILKSAVLQIASLREAASPAAIASAASFSIGAAAPLALVVIAPAAWLLPLVAAGSLAFLAFLGMVGAKAGGAAVFTPTIRVAFWGALAMGLTTGIGALIGHAV